MRLPLCFNVALFMVMLAAAPAFAQPVQLQLAHVGGKGSLFDRCAEEFAKRANKKLPANYRVVVAGESRLGGDEAVLAKIARGEVAFGLPSTAMASVSPKFGVFDLPFLIRDRDQVRKISDALLDGVFQPEAKAKGYRILAVWENGFRQITNSVRPVRRPEDLKGLKLRIPKSVWREKAFRLIGAEPIQLPLGETYERLRSGSIDGQENPLAQIYGAKFHTVQRFLSLSDHTYTPAYLLTGEQFFSGLPREVQTVLVQTAQDMRSWIFRTAIMMESDLVDQLGDSMRSNSIDLRAFRAATRPIYGEFAKTVPGGAKLIATVGALAEIDAAEITMP